MSKLETLRSLQTRIREATEANLDIDWDVWRALSAPLEMCGQKIESIFRDGDTTEASFWGCRTVDGFNYLGCGQIPRLTSDPGGLGACVALMREVLPGWRRDSFQMVDHFSVFVSNPDQDQEHAYHSLETHATLIAIVSALIAIEEAKEKADV